MRASRDLGRFWLDSDQAGNRAVEVTLWPAGTCAFDPADEVPSDEIGMRRFEKPERLPPGLRSVRTYISDGSCVTYRFNFTRNANAFALVALDNALAFQPRADLVRAVDRRFDLVLCGAGAPACPST